MSQYLYSLGLVTATLILFLTSTIKLPKTSLDGAASAQAQTNQDRRNQAMRLNETGIRQLEKGQLQEALQTCAETDAKTMVQFLQTIYFNW